MDQGAEQYSSARARKKARHAASGKVRGRRGRLTSTDREEGVWRPRKLSPAARDATQHLAHGQKQRRTTQALRSHFPICLLWKRCSFAVTDVFSRCTSFVHTLTCQLNGSTQELFLRPFHTPTDLI